MYKRQIHLSAIPVQTKEFSWTTSFNYSTNKNKLVALSNEEFQLKSGYIEDGWTGEPIQQYTHRIFEGGEVGNFYGFKTIDIDNEGRWIIEDKNGNPKGIGNFIRKTSLDEFPQFFNVLKGDMSLVGTRPPTVDEWEKYELHHRARLAIKPGLTGMWQVSGRSEITDFEEVVKLDTKYISEWSFMLDIKILFKTVLIVLGQKGSM